MSRAAIRSGLAFVPPRGPNTLTVKAVSCNTLAPCVAYVSWNRAGEVAMALATVSGAIGSPG